MSPWLFALIFRQRVLVTETFTSSRTWVAPLTTSKLESLTGEGADGTPATPTGEYTITQFTTYSGPDIEPYTAAENLGIYPGSAPDNFCEPPEAYEGGGFTTRQVCYSYTNLMTDATTGAATTGFSLTFAGGAGGAAVPSTVTNVAVTPGASYPLVIPSGGSLSLTYYR